MYKFISLKIYLHKTTIKVGIREIAMAYNGKS
jgi:hypothetical protein